MRNRAPSVQEKDQHEEAGLDGESRGVRADRQEDRRAWGLARRDFARDDGNTRRAIDIHEGERLDQRAFKAPIRAAVDLNGAQKKRRRKR